LLKGFIKDHKASSREAHSTSGQRLSKVKGAHQGKGRLVLRLAGTSLRNSITSLRISLDCIKFPVYLLVVAFAFRSPYIYLSLLLVFPMGVFPGSC
jgi:hypothetical protein